ncbi:hypothetical protein [Thalassospira xiamenensis]|uniref:Uncharacterized protein n=1 Tax=Thalassospira xiamenensis TaxID=220697 RepID=A0A285TSL5_9PROT|nr:hypothetical protein [Thalassospira xiamenensis]SOC26892.1 hypothetical protein SAMN05428964_105227 [Thalassospira xiamenensis]
MKPVIEIIKKALSQLTVRPETKLEANTLATAAGWPGDSNGEKLYSEWVNDLIVFAGKPYFKKMASDPDTNFLEWAKSRVADPYHVSFRVHDAVRSKHGGDLALSFSMVRWKQEIAWAYRMRASDNDRISFLAEMFLKAAQRDPAKLFTGIVDIYLSEAGFDPTYANTPFHELSVDDIRDGLVEDRYWQPLWLRFAEREFGRMLNDMPRARLSGLAAAVREAELQDRQARQLAAHVRKLKRWRPSLMMGVLSVAASKRLSSDDLVVAEQNFIMEVEAGQIDLTRANKAPWQIFLAQIGKWAGVASAPTPVERQRRLELVVNLDPYWAEQLPEDFIRMGARHQSKLYAWFDEIVKTGTRVPPIDPSVDYGMFLAERVGHS